MDRVNLESYLEQHDIVYNSPAKGWQNGMPLGNGDLAAISYSEGKDYCFGISKVDVWDRRSRRQKPFASHKKVMELVKRKDWKRFLRLQKEEEKNYVEDPFPTPKPCGILKIKEVISSNHRERLSIRDGKIDYKGKSADISSFVCARENLLVIKYHSKRRGKVTVEFTRREDKIIGKPRIANDKNYFWIEYPFPDRLKYVMMGRIKGIGYRMKKGKDGIHISANLKNGDDFYIYISVATSLEREDPFPRAKEIVEEGSAAKYEEIYREHKEDWDSFWKKSFISIPDKFLENLWYYSLYLLNSSSKGALPVSSGCTLWDMKDVKPWHGDFHTNDIAVIYWPIFSSNHLELGEPYYRFFYEILERTKRETKETFGIEGVKYAFSPGPGGEELLGGFWRYEIYVTAWIAQTFWWYYLYSQDLEFLKERAYPVIKDVLRFYEGYIKREKDGKYHIFPCHPVEQMPPDNYDERTTNWEKNVLIDLAMLKDLLGAGIKATEILDTNKRKRTLWKKILYNLSPYPDNGDVFLEYEGAPPDLLVHHVDMLSPVFPCGEIGMDSPQDIYRMAKRTFEVLPYHTIRKGISPFPLLTWSDEMNPFWLATIAARLGLGEEARAYLYDMGILFHLKNNGLFSISFETQCPEEREKSDLSNLKSNTGLAMTINEMLIQSYDGKIRVFPAIPEDWRDCRFARLRAVGAFLISSEISGGRVRYVAVESLEGGECNVINPWNRESIKVWNLEEGKVVKRSRERIINFATQKGKTYLIKKEAEGFKNIPRFRLKGKRRLNPREYRGPKYLAKVREDKTWLVQLGN